MKSSVKVLRCVLVTLAAMSLGSAVLAMIWNANDKFTKVMFSISIVTTIMLHVLYNKDGQMAELVDASDLKSGGQKCSCGFDSRSGYN